MKTTDEMIDVAIAAHKRAILEGRKPAREYWRCAIEAALTAAPASATHSEKLRSSLANVAKSLSSRPRELRGPFESGATAAPASAEPVATTRPERVQAAFDAWHNAIGVGPNATAMFDYILALEAELGRAGPEVTP